jgi:nucleotide-binding universal stress UspA family protein
MIKNILVHLDGTSDDEWRVAHAEPIAKAFGAYITGLFLNRIASGTMPVEAGYVGEEVLKDLIARAREEGDQAEKGIAERLTRLNLPYEIRRIDASFEKVIEAATLEARTADICLMLRPYSEGGSSRWMGIVEGVLFGSGRGVLIVPDKNPVRQAIEHVTIAWNESREAAHAVAEAMPFLKNAREVTIIMVDPKPETMSHPPGARLAQYLDHHGVKADLRIAHAHGYKVPEVLAREAEQDRTDLLVAGGYGHARIREWILGGVTRTLLHRSSIPLLLAH